MFEISICIHLLNSNCVIYKISDVQFFKYIKNRFFNTFLL